MRIDQWQAAASLSSYNTSPALGGNVADAVVMFFTRVQIGSLIKYSC
jgi:hypothetical protein